GPEPESIAQTLRKRWPPGKSTLFGWHSADSLPKPSLNDPAAGWLPPSTMPLRPPTIESTPLGCLDFRFASGLSRRELLRVCGLGVFGLSLADLLAAPSASAQANFGGAFGKAKACILLFMWGGPSQLDTWDPKPHAPLDVRGEFKPIQTRVPGIQISEH